MEDVYIPIYYAGLITLGLSLLWLIVAAARVSKWWLIPPAFLFFPVVRFGRAAGPVLAAVVGLSVVAFPVLYNRLVPPDLGPYEKTVNGEVHLTLTKWDRTDYSVLRRKPETALLQMSNPDVTDETLEFLRGMKNLHTLNLSHTGITDHGLAVLKNLPKLHTLYLQHTKITDEGFRDAVAPLENLKNLNLSYTGVSRAAGLAWRKAQPDRTLVHQLPLKKGKSP
jgi:hypothetical protein